MRGLVANVQAGALIAWRTLPELGSPALVVVRLVLVPGFTALFYLAIASRGDLGDASFGDALAAACVAAGVAAAVSCATLLSFDRFEGTTEQWALADRRAASFVSIGRNAVVLALGLCSGASSILALSAFRAVALPDDGGVSLAVACLLVASLSGMGLGLFVGVVSATMRDSLLLVNLTELGLPVLSGAAATITSLPAPAFWLAAALPTGWVTEAARSAGAAHSAGTAQPASGDLVAALVTGAVWAAAALALGAARARRRWDGRSVATF